MDAVRLEPPVGAESGPFWEATRQKTLLVQWCTACDKGIFYPRSFCPHCGATDSALEWKTASGRATVQAVTIEQKPVQAFAHSEPYVIALVDLQEGVRMMANIVGCPPESVTIGLAVTVTWEALSDGRHLPLFTPA